MHPRQANGGSHLEDLSAAYHWCLCPRRMQLDEQQAALQLLRADSNLDLAMGIAASGVAAEQMGSALLQRLLDSSAQAEASV